MHNNQNAVAIGCGIDVSATELVVVCSSDLELQQRRFVNRASGHRALIRWLQTAKLPMRVCLEATGIYSLDPALALHAAGIEVAVLNPRTVSRFAETLRRSKTDAADAQVLAEYARRMPFQPWQPPSTGALQLRAITRHRAALRKQHTMQQNRLRAAEASSPFLAACGRNCNARCATSRPACADCSTPRASWSTAARNCGSASTCC